MLKYINILIFCVFAHSAIAQIACYPLDSAIVKDAITGNTGQHSSGVGSCADRFGNPEGAMRIYKAYNGAVRVGSFSNLKPSVGTVSIWVKMYSTSGSGNNSGAFPPIITISSPDHSNQISGYFLTGRWYVNDFYGGIKQDKVRLPGTADSTWIMMPNQDPIGPNPDSFHLYQWYHLALSFTQQSITMYVDGQPISTKSKLNTLYLPGATVYLGHEASDFGFSDIAVDDYRVYDYAMSDAQVAALWQNSSGCEKFVSIDETPESPRGDLKVFPNPTTGALQLQGIESNDYTFALYDLAGRSIEQVTIENQQIDLPHTLPNGVYFLTAQHKVTRARQQAKVVLLR